MLAVCFAMHGAIQPDALDRHVGDDTYYFLQIARHIADGQGSCFSPGEPTNGYHPLWQWILAALTWLLPVSRDAMALIAICLGATLTAFSAVPFGRFLRALGVEAPRVRFMALVYLCNPWIALLAINGMETGLFLLLLWTVLAWVPQRTAPVAAPVFGAAAGLLMLARTDAIFFTGAAFLWFAVRRTRSWRWILGAGIVASLLLLPWLVWCAVTFGTVQQSSSNAIALITNEQIPAGWKAFWEVGVDRITRITYIALTYPLMRYRDWGSPYQYEWGVAAAVLIVVYLVHRRLRPRVHLPLPVWFWVPTCALLLYYTFFRHFMQVWHLSSFVALVVMIVGHAQSAGGRAVRVGTLAVLVLASLWSTRNGYFAPQDGGIAYTRRFAAEPHPHWRIGHTDGGRFAYFGRDEVVNLDGVVNNRALRYIETGRMGDYLVEQGFDRVFMTPDRFEFYHRAMTTRPAAELPPVAPGEGARGHVDRFAADGDRIRIEGWAAAGPGDAASTVPLLAFLDAGHLPLAAFEGTRGHRDDVAKVLQDDRLTWSGCAFVLRREEIPPQARWIRLGARWRDGAA